MPNFTVDQLQALNELGLLNVNKNNPASTSLTGTQTTHGPSASGTSSDQYGVFSAPGVRPDMVSAVMRPNSLLRVLRPVSSRYTEALLEVLTAVGAAGGTNATGYCGDPPSTPDGKVAQMLFTFGDFFAKTNLNSVPTTGQLRNRADVPRNILNSSPEQYPYVPDILYRMTETDNQLMWELWRLGIATERSLVNTLWQGDNTLSSTSTEWGFTKEFAGLDSLIKTGYRDAVSNQLVPALDSSVITFGADVADTIPGGNGSNIVEAVHDLYHALSDNAVRMGFAGVDWAIAMRQEAFRKVTEVYACNYLTYRCNDNGDAGNPNTTDARDSRELYDRMQRGQYLLIDGMEVPVIFDEGIPQPRITTSPNVYETDIYFVPLTWAGMPLTYLEYFPMDNANTSTFANFQGQEYLIMNNGMYIMASRDNGFCKEYLIAGRFRVITETPFLMGRIDNIQYQVTAPTRNADPADTLFFKGGGDSYRS